MKRGPDPTDPNVCTYTLHTILSNAWCNCHKFFPRNKNISGCVHLAFTQTDHNYGLCIKTKAFFLQSCTLILSGIFKLFYISWPLLIIWLYKFQFPALKGHTGWLEALVFTGLWNSRYLYSTIDRNWQTYASCQLVILPVQDRSLYWPFGGFGHGEGSYGFTLLAGRLRR